MLLSSLLCASSIVVVKEVEINEREEEKKEKRKLHYRAIYVNIVLFVLLSSAIVIITCISDALSRVVLSFPHHLL